VRGPSRSGKSTLSTHLLRAFESRGIRAGYIKRTHHELDLPGKASSRVWESAPAAMLIHAPSRLQLTLPPADEEPATLLRSLPADLDVVVLETHSPEPYPSIISRTIGPAPGEAVIGTWSLETISADAEIALAAAISLLPADLGLARAVRSAAAFHGGHACAGIALGTRLALQGAQELGIDIPDRSKRLVVVTETQRCAADALEAITGCRPGRRTLQFRDYGKLAATFIDTREGRAVRVATRGELREHAKAFARDGEDRHEAQRRAYLELPAEALFAVTEAAPELRPQDRPGPPTRRIRCLVCGEEVSDGRDVASNDGALCQPCARLAPVPERA
jgi:formylmethanofuran dehydrogenase subunit E